MQKIGTMPLSPNRYQQLFTNAFAIYVSIRYGIFDYPPQRYYKKLSHDGFTAIKFVDSSIGCVSMQPDYSI